MSPCMQCFIFFLGTQESDLGDVKIVQALNSILTSGELANLFSNDELEGLLQVSHHYS